MKNHKIKLTICVLLILIVLCGAVNLVMSLLGGHFTLTLPVKHTAIFTDEAITTFPARVTVNGNMLVNESGNKIIFHGLMPADPARLRSIGKLEQEFITEIASTGANLIRVPVHPENWVHDQDYLWRYLDPIVSWAGKAGMYVVIDWHFIGNVTNGAGPQMPDLEMNPLDLTLEFWQMVAAHYQNTPHVIFEIFNEPQSISAEVWRENANEIITIIREQGAGQLVIVGGIEYSKDLSWVLDDPIDDENVAYASHIYPAHSSSMWPHWFGDVAALHPVIITEWGYMDENREASSSYLAGDRETYGEPLMEYLRGRDIGWIACWYDDEWLPQMFTADWMGYTGYGEFVIQQLGK